MEMALWGRKGVSLDSVSSVDISALMKKPCLRSRIMHVGLERKRRWLYIKILMTRKMQWDNVRLVAMGRKGLVIGAQRRGTVWFRGRHDMVIGLMGMMLNWKRWLMNSMMSTQQGNKKDGSDVARHVREIADGLCSQLDSLIDESELEGSL
eukprot:jgi/Picre1/29522/NNA_004908.t1